MNQHIITTKGICLAHQVVAFWRKYQKKLLDQLKNKEVVMGGDGHHDSMGHSAKYGTYTIFCCTIGLILHIVLVQVFQFSFYYCLKENTTLPQQVYMYMYFLLQMGNEAKRI